MAKLNKHRGEVPLPEAGEGAFLKCTVEVLEQLESEYGDDYLNIVLLGLAKMKISVYKIMCQSMMQEQKDPIPFPYNLPLEKLQTPILDALFLMLHGRTREEQQKHEDAQFAADLEEAKKNPRLAAAIYSDRFEKQDTHQG